MYKPISYALLISLALPTFAAEDGWNPDQNFLINAKTKEFLANLVHHPDDADYPYPIFEVKGQRFAAISGNSQFLNFELTKKIYYGKRNCQGIGRAKLGYIHTPALVQPAIAFSYKDPNNGELLLAEVGHYRESPYLSQSQLDPREGVCKNFPVPARETHQVKTIPYSEFDDVLTLIGTYRYGFPKTPKYATSDYSYNTETIPVKTPKSLTMRIEPVRGITKLINQTGLSIDHGDPVITHYEAGVYGIDMTPIWGRDIKQEEVTIQCSINTGSSSQAGLNSVACYEQNSDIRLIMNDYQIVPLDTEVTVDIKW